MQNENLNNYILYSPLAAILREKDGDEQDRILESFVRMPDEEKSVLVSEDVSSKLKSLEDAQDIPPSYSVAVAKMIAMVVFGDISASAIPQLLARLNFPQEKIANLINQLTIILEPITSKKAKIATPMEIKELPPLTQRVPSVTVDSDSSKTPARNVIDLRRTIDTSS